MTTRAPAPEQAQDQQGGIGSILLGAALIVTVLIGGTLLLIPRLIISRFRRRPVRAEGYGERPLATPPDADLVAKRSRLLALQLRHLTENIAETALAAVSIEWTPERRDSYQARRGQLRGDLETALASPTLVAVATPDEMTFLRKAPAKFTRRDALDASWRAESLAVLLWALGRLDTLPAFDTQVDPEQLLEAARHQAGDDRPPALRPHAELEQMQERVKLWHWRCRTRQLEEDGTPVPDGLPVTSWEEIVRLTTEAAVEKGTLDAARDGDFKAMGKGFRWLTEDEWSSVQSIVMERHRAINWLCGYAPDNRWDDVPTHT